MAKSVARPYHFLIPLFVFIILMCSSMPIFQASSGYSLNEWLSTISVFSLLLNDFPVFQISFYTLFVCLNCPSTKLSPTTKFWGLLGLELSSILFRGPNHSNFLFCNHSLVLFSCSLFLTFKAKVLFILTLLVQPSWHRFCLVLSHFL